MAFAYKRFRENIPGSQPTEIIATCPPFFAASSTAAKCSGILAWVSKLSTTLKYSAYLGVCTGKSVALPPQIMRTSSSSFMFTASSTWYTFAVSVNIFTSSGLRRVKTAFNSMSGLCFTAHSTPRPRFPYPKIPILILMSNTPIFGWITFVY